MTYWTVAQTLTKAEDATAERLEKGRMEGNLKFTTFVPKARERRRIRGKFQTNLVPVFPGYIFLFVKDRWWDVVKCEGVVRVVLHGESPARLPLKEVERIFTDQGQRGFAFDLGSQFIPGQSVYVKDGPMYGQTGLFMGHLKEDRVRVLFQLLGQAVPTEIDERILAAA